MPGVRGRGGRTSRSFRGGGTLPWAEALEARTLLALVWQTEGPTLVSGNNGGAVVSNPTNQVIGSVAAAVADPTDPNTVYIGATNGGIWKTTNALSGNPTWTAETDNQPSLSISSLSLDPTDANRNTLVAGVGAYSSLYRLGGDLIGVLLTTDGGATWKPLGPLAGQQPQSVRAVASRGNIIVAASDSPGGLFVSTNAGNSFTNATVAGVPVAKAYDVVGDPNDPTILYAATSTGVIRSDDSGQTWNATSPIGTSLAFLSPATSTPVGSTMAPVRVVLSDALGQVLTNSTAKVTLSLVAPPGSGATLGGTTTVAAVNGVATFNDLTVGAVGTGFTLRAATDDPTVAPVTSAPFGVVTQAGPPVGLLFQVQPPAQIAHQDGMPNVIPAVTVRVVDALGVTVNSNVPITMATNDPGTPLGGTTTVAAVHGLATFTGLSIGAAWFRAWFSLVATSPNLKLGQSNTFAIVPGAAQVSAFAITRVKLAVSPAADPTTNIDPVYAGVIVDGKLAGVYRAADKGQTWTSMGAPVTFEGPQGQKPIGLLQAQGDANFSIAADSTNPNVVFLGGDTHSPGDFPTSFGALGFAGRLFAGDASQPAATRWTPLTNWYAGPTLGPAQPVTNATQGTSLVITAPNHGLSSNDGVIVTGLTPQPIIGRVTVIDGNTFSLNNSAAIGAADAGGATFQKILSQGTAPHADSRNITVNSNGDLIEVDDGGVYLRSAPNDPSGIWSPLSGNLQVTEFHSIAYDPVSKTIVGGAQDNAVLAQLAPNGTAWQVLYPSGDGAKVAAASDGTRYVSLQSLGGFSRQRAGGPLTYLAMKVVGSNDGKGNTLSLRDFETAQFKQLPAFYAPIAADAADPSRLVVASREVYESADQGTTFNPITGPIDGNAQAVAYGAKNADGTANPGVLYVGTGSVNAPLLSRADARGTLAPNVAYKAAGGGPVVGVAIDPSNAQSVYVIDASKVWHTVNGGGAWTNITGNLAATLMSVAYDPAAGGRPGVLTVGTKRGVFFSLSTSETNWGPLQTGTQDSGLPNAPVIDLVYVPSDDLLLASALGRGVWEIPQFSTNFAAPGAAPTIAPVPDQTVNNANPAPTLTVPIELADPTVPNAALTVTPTSEAPGIVPPAAITISGTGANRTATFRVRPNVTGTDPITLLVSDGTRDSFTSFNLNAVAAAGGALTATQVPDVSVDQDGESAPVRFSVLTTQAPSAVHVVGVTSSDPGLIPADLVHNVIVQDAGDSSDAANETLTVIPAPGAWGPAVLTLTLSDGVSTTSVPVNVNVVPAEDGLTIEPIGDVTVTADGSEYQIPVQLLGAPNPIDPSAVDAVSSDQQVLPNTRISADQIADNEYMLTIDTVPNQVGTTTITVSAGTEEFTSDYQTFQLALEAVSPPATPRPTGVRLSASASPSSAGQAVTYAAVITGPDAGDRPTGTVTFTVDGVAQPPVPISVVGGAAAAAFTTSLGVGSHTIGASYSGDAVFAPSSAQAIAEAVNRAATTATLVTSADPLAAGQTVVLSVTVTGHGPTKPAGTVTFFDGRTPLGSATLDASGTASVAISSASAVGLAGATLNPGIHPLFAVYGGDANSAPTTSNVVGEVVALAPAVTSVKRFGYREQPTTLVLTFSTPLAPARAQDVANYRLVTLGGRGRGGWLIGHVTPVRRAVYDPTSQSVTLYPQDRLDLRNLYRLTVKGSAGGLTGAWGIPLAGGGVPGTEFVTMISRATLAGGAGKAAGAGSAHSRGAGRSHGATGLSAAAVDTLASSGHLRARHSSLTRRARGGQ